MKCLAAEELLFWMKIIAQVITLLIFLPKQVTIGQIQLASEGGSLRLSIYSHQNQPSYRIYLTFIHLYF